MLPPPSPSAPAHLSLSLLYLTTSRLRAARFQPFFTQAAHELGSARRLSRRRGGQAPRGPARGLVRRWQQQQRACRQIQLATATYGCPRARSAATTASRPAARAPTAWCRGWWKWWRGATAPWRRTGAGLRTWRRDGQTATVVDTVAGPSYRAAASSDDAGAGGGKEPERPGRGAAGRLDRRRRRCRLWRPC